MLPAASLSLAACAFPQTPIATAGGTIYQGSTDAAQYRAPLPRDFHFASGTPREGFGRSCRTTVTLPPSPPTVFLGSNLAAQLVPWGALGVTAGDDGYASAVARARESVGGAALFDVRADLRTTSVLGVWTRQCIEVHASAR